MESGTGWIFFSLVAVVVAIAVAVRRQARDADGFFFAHGQMPWWINAAAITGDYLTAGPFFVIAGLVAFYGFDGFLYALGLLAGWLVGLFAIAEPLRRRGWFTPADGPDVNVGDKVVRRLVSGAVIVVAIMLLAAQMLFAGMLSVSLLGLHFAVGAAVVGIIAVTVVVLAGMVSTTWLQFLKAALVVAMCGALMCMVLERGLVAKDVAAFPRRLSTEEFQNQLGKDDILLPSAGEWADRHIVRVKHADGSITPWRFEGMQRLQFSWNAGTFFEGEMIATTGDGRTLLDGMPESAQRRVPAMGYVESLDDHGRETGPLGPWEFLQRVQAADIGLMRRDVVDAPEAEGVARYEIFTAEVRSGGDVMMAGNHPTLFAGLRKQTPEERWNFLLVMAALIFGGAALPPVLMRHGVVRDAQAARKAGALSVVLIGLIYLACLYVGLGAMTAGAMEPGQAYLAVPRLAGTFGAFAFALVSAVALLSVVGAMASLLITVAGAVANEPLRKRSDAWMIEAGKITALGAAVIAFTLALVFQNADPLWLLIGGLAVAAVGILPALLIGLYCPRRGASQPRRAG